MIKIWYLIVVTAWPPAAAPTREEIVMWDEPACHAAVARLTQTFSRVQDDAFYWRLDCESRLEPKPEETK